MTRIIVYENFIFAEGDIANAVRRKKIRISLPGFGAQLKNLDKVKKRLINRARLYRCNCILDFKYGQKATLFSIDFVKYYGKGVAAFLPLEEYEKIVREQKK